jgi:hypothetical protein
MSCQRVLAIVLIAALLRGQTPVRMQVEREFMLLDGGPCPALCYAPDGALLAAGTGLGAVLLLDAESGTVRWREQLGQHAIEALRFSPDGAQLAASSRSGFAVWRWRDHVVAARRPFTQIGRFDWSRDGRWLALQEDKDTVLLLAADTFAIARTIVVPGATFRVFAFDPTSARIAIGIEGIGVRVYRVADGELLATHAQPERVRGLTWCEGGQLAMLDRDGVLSGLGASEVKLGSNASLGLAVLAGQVVALSSSNVHHVDADGRQHVFDKKGGVAAHPDGKHWAVVQANGIGVFSDRELQRTLPAPNARWPREAVLSGDGHRVVARAWDQPELRVFSAASGATIGAKGLPADGQLLPDRVVADIALLRGMGTHDSGEPAAPRLEFWSVGFGYKLVRSIDLEPHRAQLPTHGGRATLSLDGRFLGVGPALLDLLDVRGSSNRGELFEVNALPARDGATVIRYSTPRTFWGGSLSTWQPNGTRVAWLQFDEGMGLCSVAVSPSGDQVLVCGADRVELRALPSLTPLHMWDWSLSQARWVDADTILGTGPNGLHLMDMWTGKRLASIPLRDQGGGRCTDYDAARQVALLTNGDRVQLVRISGR